MFALPVALGLAHDSVSREALSARPDAPQVAAPAPAAGRAHRARARLASALRRTAEVVAPPECSPAH
jgi:hypothetical protein